MPDQYGYIQNPLFKSLIKKKGYQIVSAFKPTDRKTKSFEANAILNNRLVTINNKGEIVQKPFYQIDKSSNSYSGSDDIVLISPLDDKKRTESPYEQVHINGKFGTQHKITKQSGLPTIYDEIGFFHENEYAKIKQNKKVGLALRNGKILIEPNYDFVELPKSKQKKYYHVGQNGKQGLLDSNFKIALPIIYDFLQACYSCNDSPNIYLVGQSRKFGIIKTNGSEILPIKYDHINFLMPGIIRVGVGRKKYGAVDSTGKFLTDTIFDSIMPRSDAKLIELKTYSGKTKIGLMNFSGKIVLQPIYREIGRFENGIAQIWLDEKAGLINENGKIILDPIYDRIFYRKPYYTVKNNQKYGVFSSDGKTIIPIDYDVIYPFDNIFYFEKNDIKGLMTFDKKVLKSFKYLEVIPANQFLRIMENKKYGVMDSSGKIIIPIVYDKIDANSFHNNDGIITAEKSGKSYILDRYGNEYEESMIIRK